MYAPESTHLQVKVVMEVVVVTELTPLLTVRVRVYTAGSEYTWGV